MKNKSLYILFHCWRFLLLMSFLFLSGNLCFLSLFLFREPISVDVLFGVVVLEALYVNADMSNATYVCMQT